MISDKLGLGAVFVFLGLAAFVPAVSRVLATITALMFILVLLLELAKILGPKQ